MKKIIMGIVMIVLCMSGCTAGDGSSTPKTAFTLSHNELEMAPGTREVLTAQADGKSIEAKDLWWETSDEAVVTVDNGALQAVAQGQAMIAVSNRTGYVAVCRVTVSGSGL